MLYLGCKWQRAVRAENSNDVLGSNMFSTLVTIPKNTAFVYRSYFHIVDPLSLFVFKLGASPPPSHRQEGMVLGDSLEVLRTQC